MANHEFGIMQNQPMNKERFDEYEPNKYDCIVVDDNFIEPILIDLQKLGKGLAYCGITLIPPESMDILIKILLLQDKLEYTDLIYLANQAKEENKYIIHFGI